MEELRGKSMEPKEVVIITGSCGRIGASLVKKLGERYRIVGFELLKALYASQNEELVPVDISSDESVHQAFKHIKYFYGTKITSVIHLAAYYSFADQDYAKYDKITVQGTKRLLKALQEFEVEQFIFSSTMLVHAPCGIHETINENSPIEAKWAYPKSKVATESVIHTERGKIPTVNLRISGVYDDLCHSIPISNQIQRIYEKKLEAHFFAGDLSHGASFVHMADLVEALDLCVKKRKELPPETTLLIGEAKTLSYDYLQTRISQLLFNKNCRTYSLPKPVAKIGSFLQNMLPFMPPTFIKPWMIDLADDNYTLDISKAKQLIGWSPKHTLEDTLPIMIAALQKDPLGWYKINGLTPSKSLVKKFKKT